MIDEVPDDTATNQVPLLGSQVHQTLKPPKYHWYASRYLCLISVLVFLCFCGKHTFDRTWAYLARRRRQNVSPGKLVYPHRSSVRMVCGQMVQKWALLTVLPGWLYGPDSVVDAVFTTAYCGLLFFFSLNHSRWLGGTQNGANQMGVMAFSQMPLVFILVSKNNIITVLTGISHRRLNFLHRAASRACVLCAWIHAVAWTPPMWRKGELFDAYIQWGAVALLSFTMLWLTSVRYVRRMAWELFLALHVLFTFMFLVAALLHWQKLAYWIWPAAVIWAVDRLTRWCRISKGHQFEQMKATVELVDFDVLRVTIPSTGRVWSAGQYAYLLMPTVTRLPLEAHPFSFANVPSQMDGSPVFLIKVHNDATKLLRDFLGSDDCALLPIEMEGPYGATPQLDEYPTVILFAGGTGIAYAMSIMLSLLDYKESMPRTRLIHLVWHTKSAKHIEWIRPMLEDVSRALRGSENIMMELDIYVTRTSGWPHGNAIAQDPVYEGASVPTTAPLQRQTNSTQKVHEPLFHFVRWSSGRADLGQVVVDDRARSDGPIHVSVCGPSSLILGVRTAISANTTIRQLMRGQAPITYDEETLAP